MTKELVNLVWFMTVLGLMGLTYASLLVIGNSGVV